MTGQLIDAALVAVSILAVLGLQYYRYRVASAGGHLDRRALAMAYLRLGLVATLVTVALAVALFVLLLLKT
jgi:hypothetical protein